MISKKIVVNSCGECLYSQDKEVKLPIPGGYVYYFCRHPDGGKMMITDEVYAGIINPDCPLEDDKCQ